MATRTATKKTLTSEEAIALRLELVKTLVQVDNFTELGMNEQKQVLDYYFEYVSKGTMNDA